MTRTTTSLVALATLAALGLCARPAAAAAPDVITFDAYTNEPGRSSLSPLQQANNGSPTFDGVTFSGNTYVLGDQFGPPGSPLVTPHSGNYAFTSGGQQNTTLDTTKTLYGLYLGLINTGLAAGSVTINALDVNGTVLGSLNDTLSSTTLSFFDTSAFASLSGVTGYSLVSQSPAGTTGRFDFAGDDLTFTAPATTPPATVTGTFDFDTDSVGTGANPGAVHTAFSDTSGGVVATFSSTADTASSGGFGVNGPFGAPGFSGNSLVEINGRNLPLTVSFDHTLQSGSLAFNSNGSGTFSLQELFNGVAVGTPFSSSVFGTLAFGGAAFNGLTLSDTNSQFAIDNLTVTSAAAPEPSEWAALGFTALGIGGLLLRARRRTA